MAVTAYLHVSFHYWPIERNRVYNRGSLTASGSGSPQAAVPGLPTPKFPDLLQLGSAGGSSAPSRGRFDPELHSCHQRRSVIRLSWSSPNGLRTAHGDGWPLGESVGLGRHEKNRSSASHRMIKILETQDFAPSFWGGRATNRSSCSGEYGYHRLSPFYPNFHFE